MTKIGAESVHIKPCSYCGKIMHGVFHKDALVFCTVECMQAYDFGEKE